MYLILGEEKKKSNLLNFMLKELHRFPTATTRKKKKSTNTMNRPALTLSTEAREMTFSILPPGLLLTERKAY